MLDCLKPALLAAGFTLTMATAPHAAVVSFDLSVSFVNGPLLGTIFDPFPLEIIYNDEEITFGDANDGDGFITAAGSLKIVYDGVNVEGLDVDFPGFPQVFFVDYVPVGINFLVTSFDLPELLDFGIVELFIGDEVDFDLVAGYSTFATVELAAIPLPAGLPLLAGRLGLMALAARRRKRD
jgi:hypothetical protein